MKVSISDEAKADLRDIGDWIAADNPVRADSFVRELLDHCLTIGVNPLLYPFATNIAATGVRRRLYRGYLILYRVKAECLEIIHVVHSKRNYSALFEPGDHTNE